MKVPKFPSEVDEEILQRAMIFALEKHKGQKRKGDGRPYFTHPVQVMALCWKYKKSVNIYLLGTVSLLHDTVEDCDVTIQEIIELFGIHVASLVQELSLDKKNYETLGKAEYQSMEINMMSSYAFFIKLIDILVNVCDLESMIVDKQLSFLKDKEYILQNLNRKVTDSQKGIIKDISEEIKKAYLRLEFAI
jgi:(p)ppGpp synthase/HD superfamily hydrolase